MALGAGRAATTAIGLVVARCTSAALGPGYGEYLILLAGMTLILDATGFSAETILVRDLPRETSFCGRSNLLGSGLVLKLLGNGFGAACLVVIASATLGGRAFLAGIAGALAILISGASLVFASLLRSELRLEREVAADLVGRGVFLTLLMTALHLLGGRLSLAAVMSGYLAAEAARLLVLMRASAQYGRPSRRVAARRVAYLVKESFPLGLANTIAAVYRGVNKFALGWLVGVGAAGLYGAAEKVTDLIWMTSGIVMASVFPMMVRDHRQGGTSLSETFSRTLWLSLGAGLVGRSSLHGQLP